ncbi:MAG TPA: macro domain-containing protein [Candidatus Omnitrophota bacterium]|nr:macro domain-containing protein [Candidatus Omnitrophota bacterium]HPD84344.1 macro domain-containing protein [Candidatus Omnitrophota bacterium]HRZ03202.1 macro domain-containing protein [Candidatus Omnitrophota bacterium]
MKIKNTELKIVRADITHLKVDAIVNPTSDGLLMQEGLAAFIKKTGGGVIEKEAAKKAPIKAGEAVWTKGGALKAKFVIHAAIMGTCPGKKSDIAKTDETKMRLACRSILSCADRLKLKSVALPALGGGCGGFPLLGTAKIMTQEVLKYLRENKTGLTEIIFCLRDDSTFKIFNRAVYGYLEHILYKLSEGPYVTVDVIIELRKGIILIERSNPPYGLALPGGFVDCGESLEEAVAREAKEETNMTLVNLKQLHTYSKPERDPRFHTITTVFTAQGRGRPKFGDDAKGLRVVGYHDLMKLDYAFDHKQVIRDYLDSKKIRRAH